MIIEIARGHIKLSIDGKNLTVDCEAYLPGHGSPDLVIYKNSIKVWDKPFDNIIIEDNEKNKILDDLVQELYVKNIKASIE